MVEPFPAYTVATLPTTAPQDTFVYLVDLCEVACFSNGNWYTMDMSVVAPVGTDLLSYELAVAQGLERGPYR